MTGPRPRPPEQTLLHATCVAIGTRGVLLLGPPGAGKSDLALRLIDEPGRGLDQALKSAQLVADDQISIRRDASRLIATAPPVLGGKLEVRGLGIVTVPACAEADLVLAVRLEPAAAIERLPVVTHLDILGLALPLVLIDPNSASAAARVRAALDWLDTPSNHIAQRK